MYVMGMEAATPWAVNTQVAGMAAAEALCKGVGVEAATPWAANPADGGYGCPQPQLRLKLVLRRVL